MKQSVEHRGPDQHGSYIGKDVMLGHRRLSILDLSEKGRQPMADQKGNVVVLNGEIYNYRQLRTLLEQAGYSFKSESDTEVLVHGFAHWGNALPEKLDGEYAFAAWNENRRELFLARDPIGVVPLYYAHRPEGFFFASEPKAFFEFESIRPAIDPHALAQYLTFQYAVAPKTLFSGIKKMRPGHALSIQSSNKETRLHEYRYYYPAREEIAVSESQAIAKVRHLFAQAVKKRLQSDVPLGVYLSGGLDSSWIVAQMSEFKQPHTFSVEFDSKDDETIFVEEIVSRYDTKHTRLKINPDRTDLIPQVTWHLDAPIADIAALPTYLMAQATKPYASVVLTGDGGDEVFAGYPRYQKLQAAEKIRKIPSAWTTLARFFLAEQNAHRLTDAMTSNTKTQLILAYSAVFSQAEKKQFEMPQLQSKDTAEIDAFFSTKQTFLNQMLALDVARLLPDDYLMKVNHASMAHAVEARVPFLDTALAKFASTLPAFLKADWRTTRKIQRKAMRAQGLPEKIINRKKHGFNVPTSSWLTHGLAESAQTCFESLDARKLLKKGVGQKIIERFSKNPNYFSRQFWTLFGLEIWCRVYLDSERPATPKWRL